MKIHVSAGPLTARLAAWSPSAVSGRLARSGRIRAVRMLWAAGKGWLIAAGVLLAANAVLPVAALAAMGRMVALIPAAAAAHLHGEAGMRLLSALLISGMLYAGATLTGTYQEWLSTCVRTRLLNHLQSRLMKAVSDPVGIAHLEDPEILDRLMLARGQITGFLPADAPVSLAAVAGTRIGGFLACGLLATFRWWLGLGMLLMWILVRRPMRRVVLGQILAFRSKAEVIRRAWYFLGVAVRPAAAKELRVFGLGDWVIERYQEHWSEGMDATITALRGLNRQMTSLSLAVAAAYAIASGTLAYAAFHHEIGLSTLSVMLPLLPATMYVGTITTTDIGTEWMVSALPDLAELESRLYTARTALKGTQNPVGLPRRSVRFEGVRFGYPGVAGPVLDGLDLEIPAGRSTAIVGMNGTGKTTLVKLLARLHDPSGGQITIDGTPLTVFDPRRWQRQVAVVFQDFNRYPLTLRENVAAGAIAHLTDDSGLAAAAQQAGAGELATGLPSGWGTMLESHSGGQELSSGQWQRIALARALFAARHGATLLVLDEPTAWLDVRAEAAFYDRFLELTRGLTTIVISHRFATVRRAGQICVLENGRLAESGTHDELMREGGRYASMFRVQAARFGETAVP